MFKSGSLWSLCSGEFLVKRFESWDGRRWCKDQQQTGQRTVVTVAPTWGFRKSAAINQAVSLSCTSKRLPWLRSTGVNFRFPHPIFSFPFIYDDLNFPWPGSGAIINTNLCVLAFHWSPALFSVWVCVCARARAMAHAVTWHTCGFCNPLMSVFRDEISHPRTYTRMSPRKRH